MPFPVQVNYVNVFFLLVSAKKGGYFLNLYSAQALFFLLSCLDFRFDVCILLAVSAGSLQKP